MTELFRFTIEERSGERENTNELYIKANSLTEAADAVVNYAKDFYGEDSIQETEEDGSLTWRTPGGDIVWKVGSITPLTCIAITPVNAPTIYLPVPLTEGAAD